MKKIIFDDDLYQFEKDNKQQILEYLQINDIDPLPNAIEDAARQLLDDEYFNLLDILKTYDANKCYDSILVYANLGLWYGRRKATKKFNDLMTAVTFCFEDANILFYNKHSDALTLEASHHDGTNIFKFYAFKSGRKKAINYFDLIESFYKR